MVTMWSSLLTLLEAGGEFLHADGIAGTIMVLIERLDNLGVEVRLNSSIAKIVDSSFL